jgi:hypothetical protein
MPASFHRSLSLLTLGTSLLAFSPAAAAPGEATVTLTGLSIRVRPATTQLLSNTYTASFTSADDDTINDEFYNSGGTTIYASEVIIDYPGSEALGPVVAILDVGIPDGGDADLNGLTDFQDVDRSVAGTTTGTLLVDDGMDISRGTVSATWTRAAGSAAGTVQFKVSLPDFGLVNLTFNHAFEIFHYRGVWKYAVQGNQLVGTVDLPRLGAPGGFQGNFPVRRVNAVELERAPTIFTNPNAVEFAVFGSLDVENVPFPIEYITGPLYGGVLIFADGDPTTPFTDEYDFFELLVEDRNDADGDGLPDLSDATTSPPAQAPVLTTVTSGGTLRIRLQGTARAKCTVEVSPSLAVPGWITAGEVTLDAQGAGELEVGGLGEAARFFRARTP